LAEWARVFAQMSGVVVLKNSYQDLACIDAASEIYRDLIAEEKEQSSGGDHFAATGANDRVWNSMQKLCLRNPEVFAKYFANETISAVCEAWLGPWYQVTAQVNQVRPGGRAQTAHRDYHLGFQSEADALRFPAHVHDLSPLLTLQGAIAHVDSPVESGPTKLLPFSQLYRAGYVAYRKEEFAQTFEMNFVQLPLAKGDLVFFNPALFHAAGENTSEDAHRLVNLLQVSSAMGRATEAVDRSAMCRALYPVLSDLWQIQELSTPELNAVIGATAEGYSFPTNLDTDPPIDGMVPESQAALMTRAILANIAPGEFFLMLDELDERRKA
jgi:ectoine hydroxylase-related dioxygenase (phytanoyl-CoA dioxygenase family)